MQKQKGGDVVNSCIQISFCREENYVKLRETTFTASTREIIHQSLLQLVEEL